MERSPGKNTHPVRRSRGLAVHVHIRVRLGWSLAEHTTHQGEGAENMQQTLFFCSFGTLPCFDPATLRGSTCLVQSYCSIRRGCFLSRATGYSTSLTPFERVGSFCFCLVSRAVPFQCLCVCVCLRNSYRNGWLPSQKVQNAVRSHADLVDVRWLPAFLTSSAAGITLRWPCLPPRAVEIIASR